jgi:hypothetical protein
MRRKLLSVIGIKKELSLADNVELLLAQAARRIALPA